jgi:hypothetical protein
MKVSAFSEVGVHKLLFLSILFICVSCSSSGDGDSGNNAANNPTTIAISI